MKWTILLVAALCVQLCTSETLIKVFCSGGPLFRGRVDSIVSPGIVSGHVHKVAGGNGFGPALAAQSPLEVYNEMIASTCTSCSIGTVDLSAYWHPDLYYKWPNGSLSLVPNGGLTIYYLGRTGSGAQANPQHKQFPPGFRMVSGDPFKRTFSGTVAEKAISFACLSSPGGPETNDLSVTTSRFCKNGLRLQVHFPQCWDGVNVDSPNHKSHVAFPIERPDGGNCPSTHPVRIPNLFFEAFYSVDKFPHGTGGEQRFVLATGDATGYGFHGDFLNGWKDNILQQVFDNPLCDNANTAAGNDVKKCPPVAPFVQPVPAPGVCTPKKKIPLNENIGLGNTIKTLAGCNAITGLGATAPICSAPTTASEKAPATVRFHLKSELNGKYATCPPVSSNVLTTSVSAVNTLGYSEVFVVQPVSGGFSSFLNEGPASNYLGVGSGDAVRCDKGSFSDWELFKFEDQAGGKVAIKAKKNNKYLTAKSDGSLVADSTTIGTAQLFTRVVPAGGSVF